MLIKSMATSFVYLKSAMHLVQLISSESVVLASLAAPPHQSTDHRPAHISQGGGHRPATTDDALLLRAFFSSSHRSFRTPEPFSVTPKVLA